jgi:hypothetical protein
MNELHRTSLRTIRLIYGFKTSIFLAYYQKDDQRIRRFRFITVEKNSNRYVFAYAATIDRSNDDHTDANK